jgi:hypothetical protein
VCAASYQPIVFSVFFPLIPCFQFCQPILHLRLDVPMKNSRCAMARIETKNVMNVTSVWIDVIICMWFFSTLMCNLINRKAAGAQ